ncbi:MAG: DUF1194 domain-containing protein [Nitratireductor rhodophyticola]|uniref:DUF1194 domain-containing protein n=1 Tax=Nitratireductor rhodophyticola TaxID=2854036 RepID=UPI0032D8CD2E
MSRSRMGLHLNQSGLLAAFTGFCCAFLAAAQPQPSRAQEIVDVQLVLAVDVSLSMSAGELEIQRRGYAEALTHEEVVGAILSGMHGKIAVTYFEWAGNLSQRVVVPWTRIASAEDARHFAERLSANPPSSARRTSISGALDYAGDLLAESDFRGLRRVVDVSGDGPNNQGGPVVPARDRLAGMGITINGLPLMTNGGLTTSFDVKDLDTYYRNCVIGGPGAFVVPVNDWSQFPEAIRRKLVLELAGTGGHRPQIVLAQLHSAYDCLVGEKMWRDRSWMWQEP